MLRDLNNKVAWITGAGTGIGEGSAVALAEAGMHVVLSGRRREKLEEVAQRCLGKASVELLDVADKDAVAKVAARIIETHGRIDVLVASAGINVKERNWHNVSVEDWDQVVRIDLDGAFYCCKAVLPTMKSQGEGLIVNISSWAGKHVHILTGPAYTAAKHAMNAMNESINMEAGIFGVRACAVCPGEVATPILDNRPIPVSAEDRAKMVQPEDCGELIRFLAQLPNHVCINDVTISPTYNRQYAADAQTYLPSS
ncbi:MAG TPA: oxidoreductase [Acidimicrobiaceae bacterium]|jgi:NADP-dependent 3-hydroxy acid dehydrogenase YdfG|nr:oxidoreductase [Actinomycetota bacterium]NCG39920.1 SDR family NAD(P)-dependent oxidoreductase [Actinomycetota bacterium]HAN08598.1 oxidoreductase [Acidimicrobiaceae bacterium]|tara:strand:+ start:703 stop:1467 length:765 start_codon:yes stop_codon:yes gene_type:complete